MIRVQPLPVIAANAVIHRPGFAPLRRVPSSPTRGGRWVPAFAGMATGWRTGRTFAALLALAALPAAAVAQPAPATPIPAVGGQRSTPPARVELRVAVFGNDPCPKGEGDEIVVCARLPEAERFRIPKKLRDEKAAAKATEQAWGARVRDIDTAGNETLPSGCSAVGPGGTTGCFQQFMHDSRAQKEADAAAASDVP